jgi:hypothetical protein
MSTEPDFEATGLFEARYVAFLQMSVGFYAAVSIAVAGA